MIKLLMSLSLYEALKLACLGTILVLEHVLRSFLFLVYEGLLIVIGKNNLDWFYLQTSIISGTFSYELDSSKSAVLSPKTCKLRNNYDSLFYKTHDLCGQMGITCQDYYVDTLDGFTLRLHRLMGNQGGPPVLLQHGLMMSDEAFVFDPECSLARTLFNAGYDVWLGNNRGNKYSWKHERYDRNDPEYWNFTIDDVARYDVPAMINCVSFFSEREEITYIGFSNGCAQIFAAFQDNPTLRKKINHIIGLAPAVKIRAMLSSGGDDQPSNGLVYPFFFSPDSKLFLRVFGNKAWLPSVDQWKRIFTPDRFLAIVDGCLWYLFQWTLNDEKVTYEKRRSFYYHLYSTTSTKHVHHWMQLIGQQQFVGYRPHNGTFMGDVVSMDYDFRNMKDVPLTCFIGKDDNLCDREWMEETFKSMKLFEIDGYEHLDFLCHNTVVEQVHVRVLDVLEEINNGKEYVEMQSPHREINRDEYRQGVGIPDGGHAIERTRFMVS